jgi:hypothetical protein
MSLVRECSAQRAQVVARGLRTVADDGYVPSVGLEFEDVSDEVLLLQWDLAYLGFIDPDEVRGGGARFGRLTQGALSAFQTSTGVAAIGSYDEPTAGALVRSLMADPADVPVKDLDVEAESDDVAQLQATLQRLGYMDLITGYYGQLTLKAVATFQRENAIESTGAYGPITRMALATRTRAKLARADSLAAAVPISLGYLTTELLP